MTCTPRNAMLERRAQRMRALRREFGEVAPHVPIKPSRHRQEPGEIDKHLSAERRQRATQRAVSQHAAPAPQLQDAKPWSAQDAFSIAGEKRRKKVEAGPRAPPGTGRRRQLERELGEMAAGDVDQRGER